MRRLLLLLAFALAPLGCGGDRTGLNVRIDPPTGSRVEVDYNQLRVRVHTEAGDMTEEKMLTAASPTPYRVIVWGVDGTTVKADITVDLMKNSNPYSSKITSATFTEGELKEIVALMPSPL